MVWKILLGLGRPVHPYDLGIVTYGIRALNTLVLLTYKKYDNL